MEPLAHSGRASRGLGPQTYSEHVRAVRSLAQEHARSASEFRASSDPAFEYAAYCAGTFHDLGKLEAANQTVLRTKERGGLPINHVDAGVAHLAACRQTEAAIAVYGHHIGLCDIAAEIAKEQRGRRDPAEAACRDPAIKLLTDANLSRLVQQHDQAVPTVLSVAPPFRRGLTGIERRLLLSCVVDADHFDTARHYGEQSKLSPALGRWRERLSALDSYVDGLERAKDSRVGLRPQVYRACRSASPENLILACDSPVGSGKTTAIMAYLLQAAAALDLRHIFVVLPYTNIVQQSVDVYRKALVLPGETPAEIIAAHHHQAEFESDDLRFLTTLWNAPIIVTTAVQFFETIGTNQTARLRKLHQLPGSAIFIDEAHAAMPIHLWPFMWGNIKALSRDWRCRFVLGSGSLARFWENARLFGEIKSEAIPSMIPDAIRNAGALAERSRVSYRSRPEALTLDALCEWIQTVKGPRLIVLNTVQSAAVLAQELRRRNVLTLHLSTALAPIHRRTILRLIRRRLKVTPNLDWVLVATSCVEAGVDFSFATAFRERCRTSSLVQIGGRVNRRGERSRGVVWDFIVNDPLLTLHPDFTFSRDVVEEVFRKDLWNQDLTELMTYALGEEFKRKSQAHLIDDLSEKESTGQYPQVAKLTRLITADMRLVVINPELCERIIEGTRVDRRELLSQSVQLWFTKIGKLALNQIGYGEEIYAWRYEYDAKFLGIMAGILNLKEIDRAGFAIV